MTPPMKMGDEHHFAIPSSKYKLVIHKHTAYDLTGEPDEAPRMTVIGPDGRVTDLARFESDEKAAVAVTYLNAMSDEINRVIRKLKQIAKKNPADLPPVPPGETRDDDTKAN